MLLLVIIILEFLWFSERSLLLSNWCFKRFNNKVFYCLETFSTELKNLFIITRKLCFLNSYCMFLYKSVINWNITQHTVTCPMYICIEIKSLTYSSYLLWQVKMSWMKHIRRTYYTEHLHCLTGSVLDHRSLPPEFESRHGHIWRVFHLWICFITFGGRSDNLAYHQSW